MSHFSTVRDNGQQVKLKLRIKTTIYPHIHLLASAQTTALTTALDPENKSGRELCPLFGSHRPFELLLGPEVKKYALRRVVSNKHTLLLACFLLAGCMDLVWLPDSAAVVPPTPPYRRPFDAVAGTPSADFDF